MSIKITNALNSKGFIISNVQNKSEYILIFYHFIKADATYQKKLESFIKPDLLILDDWGMTPFTDIMLNILNEVISERYENGSIIIASNRPIAKWGELFGEPVISSALLDRFFHNAHKIKFQGKSYRQKNEK